jgi:glycogen phosphorylase
VGSRDWYDPNWHYQNDPETRAALDVIFSGHFSRGEPGIFGPIRDTLVTHGDRFMHLADLTAYAQTQAAVGSLYRDSEEWTREAIINIGCSGAFSSDRTIADYAAGIWKLEPVTVK